jgi:hypothetical protein
VWCNICLPNGVVSERRTLPTPWSGATGDLRDHRGWTDDSYIGFRGRKNLVIVLSRGKEDHTTEALLHTLAERYTDVQKENAEIIAVEGAL